MRVRTGKQRGEASRAGGPPATSEQAPGRPRALALTDLLIVGAGPAGCAAAVAARRAVPSLRVMVIDAARFPRDKLCAGAISGGGLRELAAAGLLLRVPHAVATHAVVKCEGKASRVPLPYPSAVVRRLEFDADLLSQVRASGAVVLEGVALHGLAGSVAQTSSGAIRYRALIAADGVGGASRRSLGLPAGVRVPVREVHLESARQQDLFFDLDAGMPGYVWRFPCLKGACLSETSGVFAAVRGAKVGPALERFFQREDLAVAAPERGAIRLFEPGGAVGKGTALLAGEALGVDPLAGEGIRYALWSGRIAGRRSVRALERGRAPSLLGYRTALRASHSGVVLELAARLAKRLYGPNARYRQLAADRRVAEFLAALISGDGKAGVWLRLAVQLPSIWAAAGAPTV